MERRHEPEAQLQWARFLEAESAGRPEEAEAALAELFGAVPRPAPLRGFAGRVLARVRRRSVFARPAVRVALAAALVAVAIGTALLAPAVAPLAGLVGPADLVGAATQGAAALAGRVATGAVLWRDVGAAAQALARALLHPTILILLVAQFAVASLALRALAGLAVTQRRGVPHAVS